MNDTPRRSDFWIQFALMLFSVIGAVWYISGRITAIEVTLNQVVNDNQAFRQEIQDLQNHVDGYRPTPRP